MAGDASPPPARARPPASGPARCATAFGEFRAPTGVGEAARRARPTRTLEELREEVDRVSEALGRRLKILVGKPGLDGHSNGAEQIAVRARDVGMDVVYEGIRLTPVADRGQRAAGGRPRRRPVDPLGLAPRADPRPSSQALRDARRRRARSSSAGSSPRPTSSRCARPASRAVYTPKDFDLDADHARHRGAGGATPAHGAARAADGVERARDGRRARRAAARAATWPPRPRCSTSSRPRGAATSEVAALLREVSPAALGGEARGHVVGVTGPAGRGQVDAAGRARARVAGATGAASRCSPSTRRRGARAGRCSATARASPSTRADARRLHPLDRGRRARSAASRPPRAPPPRRWRPPSTSWSSRPSASARARPTSPRWPTPSRSSSSPARATCCSS